MHGVPGRTGARPTSQNPSDPLPAALHLAALHALGAALCFALMGAAIKLAGAELNTAMVVFLRNAFGLVALTPWLWRAGFSRLSSRRPLMHLARCVIGLSAMYCFFFSISHLPLAQAMLLNYCTPLYIPLIAWLWLKERPSIHLLPIVLIGLTGIAVMLRPGSPTGISLFALVGVTSGVLAAGAFVAIRRLSRTEPSLRIVFWFTSLSLVISATPLPWQWQTPSLGALLIMAAAGGLASLAQVALTRAYSLAPAAQVAPFNYLVVLFAGVLGIVFWQEHFDVMTVIGALLVIGSSLLALRIRT